MTNPQTPNPGPGRRVGDYVAGMAEETVKTEAGKAVGRLFRWLRKKLGLKEKPVEEKPQ